MSLAGGCTAATSVSLRSSWIGTVRSWSGRLALCHASKRQPWAGSSLGAVSGRRPLRPTRDRQLLRLHASASHHAQHTQQPGDGTVVMLDLWLPAPPAAVCRAIFGPGCLRDGSGGADAVAADQAAGKAPAQGLYADHLQQGCGCTQLTAGPWQQPEGRRVLTFSKPLTPLQRLLLPLGPDAVQNREVQELVASTQHDTLVWCPEESSASSTSGNSSSGSAAAICVISRCTTAGVPFADCFANLLHWQLTPQGADSRSSSSSQNSSNSSGHPEALRPWSSSSQSGDGRRPGTRLLLTAACSFHKAVPGPLRGQIERQSIQGMQEVYSSFEDCLLQHFNALTSSQGGSGHADAPPPPPAVGNATGASCMSVSSSSSSSSSSSVGAAAQGEQQACSESAARAQQTAAPAADAAAFDSGSRERWAAACALAKQQLTGDTAAEVLRQVEALWPEWAAAGCRLEPTVARLQLSPGQASSGHNVERGHGSSSSSSSRGTIPAKQPEPAAAAARGPVPSPDESAAALQVVARRAAALTPGERQQQLAKHRVVRGLVQALRLDTSAAAAAAAGGMQQVDTIAVGTTAAAAAAAAGTECRPTAAGSAGGSLSSEGAVAAALWSLAVIGGSIFFEDEAEALCRLLPACRFTKDSQVTDVLWALAAMRHHTRHLPLLEQQAAAVLQRQLSAAAASQHASSSSSSASSVEDGSNKLAKPLSKLLSNFTSMLWGLAALGHCPELLLSLLPAVLSQHESRSSRSSSSKQGSAISHFGRLCSIGRSVAVAGCLQHTAVADLAAELVAAAEKLPLGGTSKAQLMQLHQFALALQLEAGAHGEVEGLQPQAEVQGRQRGDADSRKESLKSASSCAHEIAGTAAADMNGGHELQQNGSISQHCQHAKAARQATNATAGTAWRTLEQSPAMAQLLVSACEVWLAEARNKGSKQVSACQADVAATARGGLGLTVQEESLTAGLSVDIAVPSRRLAIEVDGPTHFCRNVGGSSIVSYIAGNLTSGSGALPAQQQPAQLLPMGGTLLKRRLLRRCGWTVVSICTAHWEALRGPEQKRRYLRDAIAAAEREAAAGARSSWL